MFVSDYTPGSLRLGKDWLVQRGHPFTLQSKSERELLAAAAFTLPLVSNYTSRCEQAFHLRLGSFRQTCKIQKYVPMDSIWNAAFQFN